MALHCDKQWYSINLMELHIMANTNQTFTLSADCFALVAESVACYFDFENSEKGTADNLRTALGEAPTLELYNAIRDAWLEAYKAKKGGKVSADACDMAWSRAFKLTGMDKPKAATKAATEKAEKRDEAKKAVEKAIADYAGDAVKLADEANVAMKKGDASAAKLLTDAALKVQKENAKKASDEAKKAATAKRKQIGEMIKNADSKLLDTIIGVLTGELATMRKKTK
jgi:hypothetical protein